MKQISSLIRTFFRRPIYIKKDSDKREYLGNDFCNETERKLAELADSGLFSKIENEYITAAADVMPKDEA